MTEGAPIFVSHENEPPSPPPRSAPDERSVFPSLGGRSIGPGQPQVESPPNAVARPQTSPGIGLGWETELGEVPPPPLTEVAPAPEVRREPLPTPDPVSEDLPPAAVPPPRPSETMVGSEGPLHTAEEANTAVDVGALSPKDAERIIAAADAGLPPPKRTLLSPPKSLPPPPPLRPSTRPPPAASPNPRGSIAALEPLPGTRAVSSPPAPIQKSRSSFPPPPPRGNTLLLYGGGTGPDSVPPPPGMEAVREMLARPRMPDPPPKPGPHRPTQRPPSLRAMPPPSRLASARPAPAPKPKRLELIEELNSDLLDDDSSEPIQASAPAAERISSSSLIDAADSSPDLQPTVELPPPPAAPSFSIPGHAPSAPAGLGATPALLQAPNLGPAADVEPAREFTGHVPPKTAPLAPPSPNSRTANTMPPGRGGATSSSRLEIPTGPAFLPRRLVHSVPPQSLPPPRPPWLIPALAVGAVAAFAVAGSVFILVARWAYAKATSKPDKTEVAASASAAAPTVVPSSPPSAAPHLTTGAPCVLAGAPHVINPHAMLKQTIEVAITAERLALGFATDEHTGLVVELDPSTMSAVRTAHDRAPDTLRRVIPMVTPGADVSIFLETTRRHTILDDAHPVAANPAFFMGVTHHRLSWTRATAAPSKSLWDLESEAPVDAMHVVPLPDGGYGVAFRQGSDIFLGALHADLSANGDLARLAGLGPQVGAPTLAAGTHDVLVAWADRPAATTPWGIRWLHWQPGKEPDAPSAFPVPAGGGGGPTQGPALGSLEGGRFVMVWTEGGHAGYQVRAQALDPAGQPVGTALTVSGDGVNAGGGMPVLTPDGRGAIVFLASPAAGVGSVVAIPVVCPGG